MFYFQRRLWTNDFDAVVRGCRGNFMGRAVHVGHVLLPQLDRHRSYRVGSDKYLLKHTLWPFEIEMDLYFYRNFLSLVQQSSFYGYTSILPTKYTQAVMIGESQ